MDATERGHALKAWRKSKGLNQEQLGKLLGVGQGYVSRLEDGKHEPSASIGESLRQLSDGLITWAPDTACVLPDEVVRKGAS